MRILYLVLALIPCPAFAGGIEITQPYQELSNALGLHIIRIKADLGPDELLVVDEPRFGDESEAEYVISAGGVPAEYEISFLDGGAYSPKLEDTYTFKYPLSTKRVEGVEASGFSCVGSEVAFMFRSKGDTKDTKIVKWKFKVVAYSKEIKTRPSIPPPIKAGVRATRNIKQPG